jgi:hypothetical protein
VGRRKTNVNEQDKKSQIEYLKNEVVKGQAKIEHLKRHKLEIGVSEEAVNFRIQQIKQAIDEMKLGIFELEFEVLYEETN